MRSRAQKQKLQVTENGTRAPSMVMRPASFFPGVDHVVQRSCVAYVLLRRPRAWVSGLVEMPDYCGIVDERPLLGRLLGLAFASP